jgi:hypothetical protein
MTSTDRLLTEYQDLPVSRLGSNDAYNTRTKEQAAERKAAREAFVEGGEWPEYEYPKLNGQELHQAERRLIHILNGIINDTETSAAKKNVAYEQVAIKLAEVYRHLEVIRSLGSVGAKQEVSRERAGEMTLEIFGTPDKKAFGALLALERQRAREIAESDTDAAWIAEGYLALTGDTFEAGGVSLPELKTETMEAIKGDLVTLFPGLDAFLQQETPEKVAAVDSIEYFDQALDSMGLKEKGWNAVVSAGTAADARAETKEIRIGKNRQPYNAISIKGVPVHEALHALRSQNASEQKDPLKRRELPGNVAFEEGLLTSVEQCITGERRIAGAKYLMSLGLQLGYDRGGENKRGPRETFDIMWRRELLEKRTANDPVTEEDISAAKATALLTVLRTQRGGSLDARDLSYFTGGYKATTWLNEIASLPAEERIQKLQWVLSGKFDPTDSAQATFFNEAELLTQKGTL